MRKTRKEYIAMIWVYRKRVRSMNEKIAGWLRAIRRIEEREKRKETLALIKSINAYFGVDIRLPNMDTNHKLARNVYYKYGIESKIHGTILCKHINRSGNRAASARGKFTKTFQNLMHEATKIKTFKPRKRQVFKKLWMNAALYESMRDREKLHKASLEQPFNENIKRKYIQAKKQID